MAYTHKKILLVAILCCFICQYPAAQMFIGLQGGVSINHLNTNTNNRASTSITNIAGYNIGVTFQYRVTDWLFVQAAPNIMQKNYSFNRTDSLLGVYMQYNNTYLQIPLTTHFVYGKRLQVFVNAGGYAGYWLKGQVKGKIPNIFTVANSGAGQQTEIFYLTDYNQKYEFNRQRDNRIELGWIAGCGFQYRITKQHFLFAEGTYYQSLTDQQKKYMINQVPQYNQTFVISIGDLYLLK